MRARSSTASVSRRNPHSPSTYWSGSREARRATSARTRVELLGAERAVETHVELDPLHPERVGEQQLCVQPRRLRALLREVLGGAAEDLAEGQRSALIG